MSAVWSLQDVKVGGVSLKSFAYGLELDALDTTVRRRGENLPVSFRRGRVWRPKQLDEVTRSLYLWVDHASAATGLPPASREAALARLNYNVRQLQALFATETSQIVVEREVILPDGAGTTTETWTAYAEVVDAAQFMPLENTDEIRKIEVPLLFSDPLWYGPIRSVALTSDTPVTVNNSGELTAEWVAVNFNDGTNPRLRNSTGNDVWVEIMLNIGASDTVYVRRGYCYRDSDGANLIGYLRHVGARSFMRLLRGDNLLTLTGGGTASISFREPHL